jgi:hypothetical protein
LKQKTEGTLVLKQLEIVCERSKRFKDYIPMASRKPDEPDEPDEPDGDVVEK